MSRPQFDLRRSLFALDQHTCLIAAVELSQSTWLVGGIVLGIARDPLRMLAPPDPEWLLKLLSSSSLAQQAVPRRPTENVLAWRVSLAAWYRWRIAASRRISDDAYRAFAAAHSI